MGAKRPGQAIAGIILAAGQSKRMQWPTALLPLPDGRTLLENQADLLRTSGCHHVIVVTGAHTTLTRERLPRLKVTWGHNARWQGGVFVSLQIGLALALAHEPAGIIVLPVDVVGILPTTVKAIAAEAHANAQAPAIVATWKGKQGNIVYLSRSFTEQLSTLDASHPQAKLTEQLKVVPGVLNFAVDDPRVVLNINTQQDWRTYLDSMGTFFPG